jgi:integrase
VIRSRRSKDGGLRFYVYVPGVGGKRVYVGAFGSKRAAAEAEQEHAVTQRKIGSGELPAEVDLDRTLREACDGWLERLEQRSFRSLDGYRDRLKLYVWPKLGKVPLARLTKAQVMNWRDDLAVRLSPKTVNVTVMCLSSAFTYFIEQQWTVDNPCRGIRRLEEAEGVYTWIQTRAEITKLLEACPRGVREIATVAVGTGLRLDEILHLQWVDVDVPRRLIAVHRGRKGTTKSGKARRVPILDSLLPFFRELALQRDGDVLLFPGEKGKSRSKPGIQFPFKQAVARAGLPPSLRFHDLRHTMASHWVLDGGDIFRLSKILGHSSVALTEKVYAHLAPDAFEQDYHRVGFVVPGAAVVYPMTKRKPALVAV